MAETVAFKYRAFISYSHADTAWAKWLHKALEGFRIDKDLAGRETTTGAVPKSLRPVFRDRDDFTAGHSLTDQTLAALDASAALIVICSPSAARSDYVTEEIRLFKSRHPGRPVIPLIVDGTPGDADNECFPPSLKYKLTAKGQIGKRKVELLTADAREEGDGKQLALAKVVAGLLGVSSDDIFRRAVREERRKGRIRGAIAGVIALLIVAGGFLGWQAYERQKTLAEVESIVASFMMSSAQAAERTDKPSLTEAVTMVAQGASQDPRYAKAMTLFRAGKHQEAVPLLKAVAKDKAAREKQATIEGAGAFRTLGAIAGLGDPKEAREAYAGALEIDPDDAESAYWYGYLNLLAGDLDEAERSLRHLMDLSADELAGRGTYRAHLRLGEIALAKGDPSDAEQHQEKALAIASQQSAAHPEDAQWQRDLWASYDKIGDLFRAKGDLAAALERYRAGVEINEALVENDPGDTIRERDLSTAYIKYGDAQRAFGDLDAALKSYELARAIRARLAADAPEQAGWQRDLSVVHERIGDVQLAEGDFEDALASYETALTIRRKLAASDPDNAGWQRDLSISEEKLGDLALAYGDPAGALKHYETSARIREQLAALDPDNVGWQRDLSVSLNKVGDVHRTRGDLAAALGKYETAFDIRQGLAKRAPGSAQRQADLAASYARLAQVHAAQGERTEALRLFRAGRGLIAPLAERSGSALWQGYVARFDADIAALED